MKTVLEFAGNESGAEPMLCGGPSTDTLRFTNKRLRREWKTMAAMVYSYCHAHHKASPALCEDCEGLLAYATVRLERCRFGAEKPTCANCPVHCYQKQRRDQMKAVMRFAGPRMLWQHPILSLLHWIDGFRKAPPLPGQAAE